MGAAYLVILILLFVLGIPAAFAMGGTSALLSLVERGPRFFLNCGILAQKSAFGSLFSVCREGDEYRGNYQADLYLL